MGSSPSWGPWGRRGLGSLCGASRTPGFTRCRVGQRGYLLQVPLKRGREGLGLFWGPLTPAPCHPDLRMLLLGVAEEQAPDRDHRQDGRSDGSAGEGGRAVWRGAGRLPKSSDCPCDPQAPSPTKTWLGGCCTRLPPGTPACSSTVLVKKASVGRVNQSPLPPAQAWVSPAPWPPAPSQPHPPTSSTTAPCP